MTKEEIRYIHELLSEEEQRTATARELADVLRENLQDIEGDLQECRKELDAAIAINKLNPAGTFEQALQNTLDRDPVRIPTYIPPDVRNAPMAVQKLWVVSQSSDEETTDEKETE